MKLITLKCPECGATLQLDQDRKECFCTYCGSKILLDEEIQKQDIRIEKRIIDEVAVEQEKTKRQDNIIGLIIFTLIIIWLFVFSFGSV